MPTPENPIAVLLRGEDSGGQLGVIDELVPAGVGPPLHVHEWFDEAFYVLAGELTFQLGDARTTVGPGQLAFARRGEAHTFANLSGAEARVLIVVTPAGFERYFLGLAAELAGAPSPPELDDARPFTEVLGPGIAPK
jgi:quercetin dioxygenase-like cupin family protein